MTDKRAKSGAERQAEYSARMKKDGYKRTTVWVKDEDWQAGYKAGAAGQKSAPPAGIHRLSWFSGYIEGEAKREKEQQQ